MVLQSSGTISINDIATEFGGTTPHSLSEYYRGGGLVPDHSSTSSIPTSGTIDLNDFYGTQLASPGPSPGSLWGAGSNGFSTAKAQSVSNDVGNVSATTYATIPSADITITTPVQLASTITDWVQHSQGLNMGIIRRDNGEIWDYGGDPSNTVWSHIRGNGSHPTTTGGRTPTKFVNASTTWKQVTMGWLGAAWIKNDGRLWMSGSNDSGFRGNASTTQGVTGTNSNSMTQTTVATTDWESVFPGYQNIYAVRNTGNGLWSWGWNSNGQLFTTTYNVITTGDGCTSGICTPENHLTSYSFSGGHGKMGVSRTGQGSFAIDDSGNMYVPGYQIDGGFPAAGPAAQESYQVQGGAVWKQGTSLNNGKFVIKNDGRLWSNHQNTAMTGTAAAGGNVTSLVQVYGSYTNWSNIDMGGSDTNMGGAIKTDGRLWYVGVPNNAWFSPNTFASPIQFLGGSYYTDWQDFEYSKFAASASNAAHAIRS